MQTTPDQLSQILVLSGLQPHVLSVLSQNSQVKTYRGGEVLFFEGARLPPKLHAVLSGEIQAQKTSVAGKETVLRWLPAGEIFAAPALFGNGIAIATVIAVQDCQIVTIEKSALLKVIQSTPEVALQILQCFNQRLQEMHRTIHGLVSERATVRLARTVQYTAQRYGTEQTTEGSHLNVKLPYQQMARMIGITYEECVRLVNKDLHSIIDYRRGGKITILDAVALEVIASNATAS